MNKKFTVALAGLALASLALYTSLASSNDLEVDLAHPIQQSTSGKESTATLMEIEQAASRQSDLHQRPEAAEPFKVNTPPDKGKLLGKVLSFDGNPIARVTVKLEGESVTISRTADTLGNVEFSKVPVGAYEACATWQHYGNAMTRSIPGTIHVFKGDNFHEFYMSKGRAYCLVKVLKPELAKDHLDDFDSGQTWSMELTPVGLQDPIVSGSFQVESKGKHERLIAEEQHRISKKVATTEPVDHQLGPWYETLSKRLSDTDYAGGVLLPLHQLPQGDYLLRFKLGGVSSLDRTVMIPIEWKCRLVLDGLDNSEVGGLISLEIDVVEEYQAAIRQLPN